MTIKKERRGWLIITIPAFIVSLVLMVGFIYGIYDALIRCELKRLNIAVEATIVKKWPTDIESTDDRWDLIYLYVDENGVEYWGRILTGWDTQKAEAAMGKKVKIYIDGKDKSDYAEYVEDAEKSFRLMLILSIVFTALTGFILVFYLIPHKVKKKNSNFTKERMNSG
ncbi:MAG: hypothetical protein LBP26_02370 [Clostridiales bacterium]|nr:hypothetical protein [Clostridiales bacterium]